MDAVPSPISWSRPATPPSRRGALGLLAALALAGRLHAAEAPPSSGKPDLETSWFFLPALSWDTDDGVGAGGRLDILVRDPDRLDQPYRTGWTVQGYAAVSGFQSHRIRVDRLDLGAAGLTRLTAALTWRQWKHDAYYGLGNGTIRPRMDGDDNDRWRYALYQPQASVLARRHVSAGSAWSFYGEVHPRYTVVETWGEDTLLAQEDPYGMDGGLAFQVAAGVLVDTRRTELVPHRGFLLEAGGRVIPAWSASPFGGPLLSVRGYRRVLGWGCELCGVVLAGRITGEWLLGDVPFYEMTQWGGYSASSSFGGSDTVRGAMFNRWRAPGKAVAGAEVRVLPFEIRILRHPVSLEFAPFVDVGSTWGAGDDASTPPPDLPVHPAAGLGGRLIVDRSFVNRLDIGWAYDPVEGAEGWDELGTLGVYAVFDYPF